MITYDNVLYLLACNINDFFALFVFNVRLKKIFFISNSLILFHH